MAIFPGTSIQISPCILSKVRFALGMKIMRPENDKRCSQIYWSRVVDFLCVSNNIIDGQVRQRAIDSYTEFMNN
jgi:hypothetical protein